MQRRTVIHKALALTLSASFLIPTAPLMAQERAFPIDLLPPIKSDTRDTGLFPKFPHVGPGSSSAGKDNQNQGQNQNSNQGNNQNSGKPGSNQPNQGRPNSTVMATAKVPDEFSCQLFENKENSEIFAAIDALSKEVKTSPACTNDPSAKTIQESGNQIKESLASLMAMLNAQNATEVNTGQIDQSITAAIGSLGNIGDIINNNEFLNSDCGRQTMSTGKLLLAVNDVISGLSPYALLAVSMNAALAPALPFVIGAVVGTTGISAISKMFNQKLIDLNNPEHRKAIVQNTCQFVKVSKKVQFLQLAQTGKIEQINNELMKQIALYSNITNLSQELTVSMSQKDQYISAVASIEQQYTQDRAELVSIEEQIKVNNDDFLMCILTSEMSKWGRDGKSFPASAFNNLRLISTQADRTTQAQATALKALHEASIVKIERLALDAATNNRSLTECAQTARSWLNGINQALKMTYDTTKTVRANVEAEMSRSSEYVTLQNQTRKIESERQLVSRVQRAMHELSQDTSIIDRSEMAQRMVSLKAGLFNAQTNLPFVSGSTSLVQQWINHTKKMHDQAMASVQNDFKALHAAAYSITDAGKILSASLTGTPYVQLDAQVGNQSYQQALNLGSFTLRNLPLGSREHELACQQLQTTWIDYTAAIDHLGAIQYFCNMIDPVLDSKVDGSVLNSCRGNVQLNGTVIKPSTVDQAQARLVQLGYQDKIKIIRDRTRQLQCPIPSLTIMNQ